MIIGGTKDSSCQSFIFPSLNSFILHSAICIRTPSYLLQKESLSLCTRITFVACSLASLLPFFVTLSSHFISPIRFAIKGATSFSSQGKLQVAGECYTVVEVGQVSLFVLALSTSVRLCICPSVSNAIALPRAALF